MKKREKQNERTSMVKWLNNELAIVIRKMSINSVRELERMQKKKKHTLRLDEDIKYCLQGNWSPTDCDNNVAFDFIVTI